MCISTFMNSMCLHFFSYACSLSVSPNKTFHQFIWQNLHIKYHKVKLPLMKVPIEELHNKSLLPDKLQNCNHRWNSRHDRCCYLYLYLTMVFTNVCFIGWFIPRARYLRFVRCPVAFVWPSKGLCCCEEFVGGISDEIPPGLILY